jgi:gamma-butyrobetaine dioxygenase
MACAPAPVRTRDPERIRPLVERDGAAILFGWGCGAEDAVDAARAVFGSTLLDVSAPAEMSSTAPADEPVAVAHTDGAAYGNRYPDFVLLSCAGWSVAGGDHFLVDGEAVVDHLASGPGGRDLVHRLQTVVVDHNGPAERQAGSPVIGRTIAGRLMLRRFQGHRAAASSTAPAADAAMLARWRDTIDRAAAGATRFAMRPGDVAVVDNYRMMHGRDPCPDPQRRLWRVWIWTTAAYGVPGRERVLGRRAVAD